jgi:hypothetical protein
MDEVRVRPLHASEQKNLRRLERQEANACDGRHARIVLPWRGGVGSRGMARRCDRLRASVIERVAEIALSSPVVLSGTLRRSLSKELSVFNFPVSWEWHDSSMSGGPD